MAQGMRSGTVSIALAATVLVHVGIAWWLLTLRQTSPARESDALTVTWIERPVPVLPPPLSPPVSVPATTDPATPSSARAPRSSALQAVELATQSIDDEVSLPTASALLEQAGEWARQQAPAADFSRDPLQHRPPPAADGRFAMRDPVSVEDVVIAVGKLFGGGPSDPCPRIRRNIANLGTGGDAELTAEEIRRLQQYCL
ncbi:hypothetical protein [Luteimonas fraxinea]|uniref:hypothetical protein n=1 Tax=Luteimonas fraxinea TaxID=2901869 RepID=UPI001E54E81D|nr:hypothetical protein [Luteimonas fraxinea]MCD9127422.1 hypothetical protein [Luteimonas fraxinea]